MHKFTRSLLTEWRKLKLPFAGETILIAVSGGADSAALTAVLRDLQTAKKLALNFIVAHFNHGLRAAEADADAEFVARLAKNFDFEFVCGNWRPAARDPKENLEQSARNARYDFLRKTATEKNASAVLTAHTINDQAETILLNLLRGSGIEGLGAMRKIRKLKAPDEESVESSVILVRPLLGWAQREQTEDFARYKEIDFRCDSMNADENFSRVKVRQKLVPLLREFNPKIVETLARTAFILQNDAERLAANDDHLPENLSVKELQSLSSAMIYSTLRGWLKNVRGDLRQIETRHLEAVEKLVFSRRSGRKVELPKGEAIFKRQGKLVFEKPKVEKSRSDN